MTIQDLIDAMESIAPLRYAESWDKVGLHLGVSGRDLSGPVLLTIDLTEITDMATLSKPWRQIRAGELESRFIDSHNP